MVNQVQKLEGLHNTPSNIYITHHPSHKSTPNANLIVIQGPPCRRKKNEWERGLIEGGYLDGRRSSPPIVIIKNDETQKENRKFRIQPRSNYGENYERFGGTNLQHFDCTLEYLQKLLEVILQFLPNFWNDVELFSCKSVFFC